MATRGGRDNQGERYGSQRGIQRAAGNRYNPDHNVGAELFDDGPKPLRWLLGQLHNCTDILPGRIASALESSGEVRLGMRRSYGAAAHQLRNWRAPDDPRGIRVP